MARCTAASPREIGLATSDRRLIGAISISIAVMNDAKVPTVMPARLCHSAMQITTDSAAAASIWVSGVIDADATAVFMASWRSELLKPREAAGLQRLRAMQADHTAPPARFPRPRRPGRWSPSGCCGRCDRGAATRCG